MAKTQISYVVCALRITEGLRYLSKQLHCGITYLCSKREQSLSSIIIKLLSQLLLRIMQSQLQRCTATNAVGVRGKVGRGKRRRRQAGATARAVVL